VFCGCIILRCEHRQEWWKRLKRDHNLLSIAFGTDQVFTRAQRIMVVGVLLLFTCACNCFLFIFSGNANDGKDANEKAGKYFTYMAIVSVCQMPLILFVTLLFKRSAYILPQVVRGQRVSFPIVPIFTIMRACSRKPRDEDYISPVVFVFERKLVFERIV
jgi:hypothetical protein